MLSNFGWKLRRGGEFVSYREQRKRSFGWLELWLPRQYRQSWCNSSSHTVSKMIFQSFTRWRVFRCPRPRPQRLAHARRRHLEGCLEHGIGRFLDLGGALTKS